MLFWKLSWSTLSFGVWKLYFRCVLVHIEIQNIKTKVDTLRLPLWDDDSGVVSFLCKIPYIFTLCCSASISRYNSSLSKARNGVEVALMKAQIAAIFEGLFDEITSSRGGPFVSRQVGKISGGLDVFVNVRDEPMVWHRSDLYLKYKWKLVLWF